MKVSEWNIFVQRAFSLAHSVEFGKHCSNCSGGEKECLCGRGGGGVRGGGIISAADLNPSARARMETHA